jgi:RND superfamily putative drug exporter
VTPLATDPTRRGLLGRVAAWCYRRRRRVLLSWVILLIGATAAAQLVGTHFENRFTAGNTPSQRALNILQSRFPSEAGGSAQVVFQGAQPLTDPSNRRTIEALAQRLRAERDVASVASPFAPGGSYQISRDGRIGYLTVDFTTTSDRLPSSAVDNVIDTTKAAAGPGLKVALGGMPIASVVSAKPGPAEGIGVTAAILIMLIAFGSVVAMGLPIVVALVGLAIGIALEELGTHLLVIPGFSPELAAMMGLGVGIDYALLIVTRYRQYLGEGLDPEPAVVTALSTSGRAVLIAGGTVVVSLLGLFLVGQPYMIGLSAGAIATVLLVLLGSLTLLPAMLGFAGRSIERLSIRRSAGRGLAGSEHGFWYRWSRMIQRHPWRAALGSVAALVLLALPMFSMRLAFSDAGNDPPSLTTRQAFDLLARGFGPGFNGPLVIAMAFDRPGQTPVADRLATQVRRTPGVVTVVPPRFDRSANAAVIVVYPATAPQAAATQRLVLHLRSDVIAPVVAQTGVVAEVGGETAGGIDASDFLSGRLLLVIGVVILVSFVLLCSMFRSLAIPLKAAVMNLLSIGAAYGVMVAVFQWGWLGSLFAIGKTSPIDPWIPLVMFTILFGLSMDYEVFLLSRIAERWRETGDNSTSVADGLARTARVITAAAAIMFFVFGSFVVKDPLHILKVFGLGLAAAILIDSTLVRMVLVPSVMELIGRWNWWIPRWLDRALPRVGLDQDDPVGAVGSPTRPAAAGDGSIDRAVHSAHE